MSTQDDIRFQLGPIRVGRTRAFWSLSRDEWKKVLKSTFAEFKDDQVTNLAAVVTLRIILSLVPSLIAAVAIAAQVIDPADITDLVNSADGLVPGSAEEFVDSSLQTALDNLREDGTSALIISIGAGLFAASGAAAALVVALNRAYDVDEGRGFVGQRVAAFGILGALVLAMIGLFVAIVLGPSLLDALLPSRILESGPLIALITLGRYLAAIVILMLFFSFAFWFGPHRDRPPLRFLTPGAVSGVVLWLVLSFLFGLYVSVAGSYNATYGAFAGLIVMIVWLQYSFTVLLLAAELDHELEVHLDEVGGAAGDGAGADHEPDDLGPADLDRVTEDMPRHAQLMASRGASTPSSASVDGSPDEGRTAASPPVPRLIGAAATTPGAGLAARLWDRLAR